MNPDELLDHVTCPDSGAVEALVAAARTRAGRRRAIREAAAAAAVLACAFVGIAHLPRPAGTPPPVAGSPRPVPLTDDELLDAFGDQPVALVTYPDGSQRLLAIVRP
jgi:hypothetical protein